MGLRLSVSDLGLRVQGVGSRVSGLRRDASKSRM